MPREPTLGELAEDMVDLRREVRMLSDVVARDFVRADLHNEQIGSVRGDIARLERSTAVGIADVKQSTSDGIAAVKSMQMWMLTLLGTLLVAVVVAYLTGRGG